MIKASVSFDKKQGAWFLGQEPVIFHCHHYNCFLQYSLESAADYVDVQTIQLESARAVSRNILEACVKEDESMAQKEQAVSELFRFCGLGVLEFKDTRPEGGTVTASSEHFATGWKIKFGQRKAIEKGVSLFAAGFIAAAFDLLHGQTPGSYAVEQTLCISKGDAVCSFEIRQNTSENAPKTIVSPGLGIRQADYELQNPQNSTVSYTAICDAVASMPFAPNTDGLIPAFDVMLTRLPANYYCLVSYLFLDEMKKLLGEQGLEIVKELLVEAGHVCAFYTLGNIMLSAEWEGLVRPMLGEKTDRIHGILGVINAMGWGLYEAVEPLNEKELQVKITGGYEANSFLAYFERPDCPVSFFAMGGMAGVMNLIYNRDISERPTLDEAYYHQVFKSGNRYVGSQTKCRASGEGFDLIRAVPESGV